MFGTVERLVPPDGMTSPPPIRASPRTASRSPPSRSRYPVPDDQGMFDSMHAASPTGATSRASGRELIVKEGDAALLQYKERILEACATSSALKGGGGVFDNTGAQEAVDSFLVDVRISSL